MSRLRPLIPACERVRLTRVLTCMLGRNFYVVDEQNQLLLGEKIIGESTPFFFEEVQVGAIGSPDSSAETRKLAVDVMEALLMGWGGCKEIELARRQAYQAEKLAAVGRLAAGIAHEINNPCAFVQSNLRAGIAYLEKMHHWDSLIDCTDSSTGQSAAFILDDFQSLLHESLEGVARISRIVRDLRGFSGVDLRSEDMADLNEILRSSIAMIRSRLVPQQTIELHFGSIPRIMCLPAYLAQAFMEILLNACQATQSKQSGKICVRTWQDGEYISIQIEDNGEGMGQDVIEHAFDPFFSTRLQGEGTGLGLTVASDIVQTHGGSIVLDSIPNEGTKIKILIPAG